MLHRRLASLFILFVAVVVSGMITFGPRLPRQNAGVPRIGLASTTPKSTRLLAQTIAHFPLSFEENRGQFDSNTKFLSRGASYGLYLSGRDAVITHQATIHVDQADVTTGFSTFGLSEARVSSTIRLSWVGSNPRAEPRGVGRQKGVSNYLLGNDPRKWHRHVAHYDRVRLHNLYPGIDLTYYGNQQRVEFDYVVAPHADPKSIQVAIDGPSLVSLDPTGRLSISSAGDEMLLLPPVAYQETNGQRTIVATRYVLLDSHHLGFEIGAYDPSRPLTIDPVLDFATAFGPNDNQSLLSDVVLDATGNIYVTGMTCDTNYPTTAGVLQPNGGSNTANICGDVVVTKLDPTASTLLYSTYIGSQTGLEFGARLLVDTAGEVTLGGTTSSSDFPTTAGAFQQSLPVTNCVYNPLGGTYPCAHGFLLKLSADGSTLVYSTLLGGERFDAILSIAKDSHSNTYVTGGTNSVHFPTAGTPYSTTYGGGTCEQGHSPCSDVFVAEFNSDGTQLLASTYIPGNDDDFAGAIAIDTLDNVYVAGTTFSANYPHTAGVVQPAHAGTTEQGDVFVSKLPPSLSSLTYSTFLGGTSDDFAVALRVDSTGAVYVTGSTDSSDFPVTAGAYQTAYKGPAPAQANCPSTLDSSLIDGFVTCGDAFLAKLNPNATALTFATFLGGSASDFAYNLAIDSAKNVWLFGNTNSTDFPYTSDAYFTTNGSGLFLSEIKTDGSALLFSTPLSQQSSSGLALGITVDPTDNVVVAGQGTISSTPGSYNFNSGGQIFVMKFSPGTARPGIQLSANSLSFAPPAVVTAVNSASAPQSVTLTNNGTGILHLAISVVPPFGVTTPPFSESDNCGSSLAAGANCTISAVFQPTTAAFNQGTNIQINSDAPNSPQSISLNGSSGIIESASFTPPTLAFPGQAPGTTSAAQTSNLNNSATSANSFFVRPTGNPVIGGANASDFQVDTSLCSTAVNSCLLTVSFKPVGNTPINRTASVTVPSQAANSPEVLTLTGTVSTTPVIAVSTNPVLATPTVVGQTTNSAGFSVKNTGGGTLTVTNLVLSGPNASDFAISAAGCTAPAFTLTSQAACSLQGSFTPSGTGNRTATLTFTDNETNPTSITLTGFGATNGGPELGLTMTPNPTNGQIFYPDTVVGHTTNFNISLISLLNFASVGSSSGAHITSATLTGDFTQTNNCPVPPAQLTGQQNCTYTVLFAPAAAGLRTGTLTINTDAPGSPSFSVNFAGNGVTIPSPMITPLALNFGPVVLGSSSAAQNVTLSNTGNGPLTFTAPVLAGPFSLSANTCASPLAASGSCTLSVKFNAAAKGPASGTLTLTSNAAGQTLSVGLRGTGVTGPLPSALPASLAFGNQPMNTTSAAKPVTLSNSGDTSFSIVGIHASENFSQTNNCGASLTPGTSCTINVSFAPGSDTFPMFPTSGQVFVTTNAPGSPLGISLSGTPTASTGAATTISVTSSANPSTVGQSVTFTATVTSQTAGTITGTVTFMDGGTSIGTGNLSAGKATFSTTALTAGNHSINASYPGDANFAPSTSSGILQTVNAGSLAATSTALASSQNPSTVGQSVTFTATITSQTSGSISGTVNFLDGATQIGSGVISSGKATFSTTTLTQGSHAITAHYAGDSNFASSTSTAVTQTVNSAALAATTTALSSATNPSTIGQSVAFIATVSSQTSGTITGTVNFLDGSTSIGSGTVSSGKATISTSALTAGTHSITAQYAGDSTFAASTSTAVSQVVNPSGDFGISVSPTTLSLPAGQSGSATITVTPLQGATFAVNLSCGTLPAKLSCSPSPTSLTQDGTNPKTATVTIATVKNSALPPTPSIPQFPRYPFALVFSGLFVMLLLFAARLENNSVPRRVLLVAALVVSALGVGSCSGGGSSSGSSGTAPGTYPITLTGASATGSLTHSTTLTVTVTK